MRAALAIAAALVATLAQAVEAPEAPICRAPPPPGIGLGPDGRGVIHVMEAGVYDFNGVAVGQVVGPREMKAGSYAAIAPHFGLLRWTRNGVTEPVPVKYLYPTSFFSAR